MIPLSTPNLIGNESLYLQECVNTNFVSSVGNFVSRFENMVAIKSKAKYGVATLSGTAGLHVSLVALGVGYGDLVVLPSFTFISSANSITYCGAEPWLFDISPIDWCLDVDLLQKRLLYETNKTKRGLIHKASGKRIVAIMPVYTLGIPANMDRIVEIAKEYNLYIISDAAAAIGATYKGKHIGELLANVSVFFF